MICWDTDTTSNFWECNCIHSATPMDTSRCPRCGCEEGDSPQSNLWDVVGQSTFSTWVVMHLTRGCEASTAVFECEKDARKYAGFLKEKIELGLGYEMDGTTDDDSIYDQNGNEIKIIEASPLL